MGPFMFPDFDPVAIQIGPLAVRWYALAYIAGIVIGWRYAMRMAERPPGLVGARNIDDFMVWAVVAIIVGGRLGQVLFYHPGYYLQNPLEIPQVWKGGMSFHGGLAGVIVAMIVFTRMRKIPLFAFGDLIGLVAPIGIFLGRIANFINGEHWGRPTDAPWGVIFPHAGDMPRHPSQLYEAALEGLLLYLLVAWLVHARGALLRPGLTAGVFLCGYAVARSIAEVFREPEVLETVLPLGTTWGQWLSLPMLLFGAWLVCRALRNPPATGPTGA